MGVDASAIRPRPASRLARQPRLVFDRRRAEPSSSPQAIERAASRNVVASTQLPIAWEPTPLS